MPAIYIHDEIQGVSTYVKTKTGNQSIMFSRLNSDKLVDTECPPRGVGKPVFQTYGSHGLQDPERNKWCVKQLLVAD